MIILVTGSHNWTDFELIQSYLERFPDGSTVVLGQCEPHKVAQYSRGAEYFASRIAGELGRQVHVCEVERKETREDSMRARNAAAIDYCTRRRSSGEPVRVLAFPLTGSRGTWDCIYRAEQAGLPVTICQKYLSEPALPPWINPWKPPFET